MGELFKREMVFGETFCEDNWTDFVADGGDFSVEGAIKYLEYLKEKYPSQSYEVFLGDGLNDVLVTPKRLQTDEEYEEALEGRREQYMGTIKILEHRLESAQKRLEELG